MKVKKGYVTLVMLVDSEEALNKVRAMADSSVCKAWSMAHELNRLTLIEDALEKGDLERARAYISLADVPNPDDVIADDNET